MKLENTLNNLRKSKNSFFNFNGNEIINFDLCKNKMMTIFDCITYQYGNRIVINEKIFIEKWEFSKFSSDRFFITKKPVLSYIWHGHVLINEINYKYMGPYGDVKFLMRLCN